MSISSKKWMLELIWWTVTMALTAIILLPIYTAQIKFDWLIYNIVYLLGALTISRYIFSFHRHPLAQSRIFKVLVIFSVPILFFPVLEGLHSFVEFNDQIGIQSILGHLSLSQQDWFIKYIRIEYIFSAVTCMAGIMALIVKMLRSLWRQYKFGVA